MRKQTKQLKSLRLRKESLKVLTAEQQLRVHAGDPNDPWDLPTLFPCTGPSIIVAA